MPIASGQALCDLLRRQRLLEPHQLDELAPIPADPRRLADELLQRGWLTSYQIDKLFQERADELTIGSYVVRACLGKGGMGEVFQARDKLGRIVALKVIRQDRLGDKAVARFLREIRAVAQLDHCHVVRALDADCIDDKLLLVMEYIEGTDLSRLVKTQGPLSLDLACDYVCQAALGLQHAHEQGMVHRDVKPANLMLAGGVVKLMDLGLARLNPTANSDMGGSMTESGTFMGSPDFIAPEQARDAHRADIRADVYSLGCTLYYLLTGCVPFPRGSVVEKLFQHNQNEPFPVESLRPEVPATLVAIVRKLMAKRPEERYQTPAEVVDALATELTRAGPETDNVAIIRTPPLRGHVAGYSRAVVWFALATGVLLTGLVGLLLTLSRPSVSQPEALSPAERDFRPLRKRIDDGTDAEELRRDLLAYRRKHPDAVQLLEVNRCLTRLRSGLDDLDGAKVPKEERLAWQPPQQELVAVLGSHRGQLWGPLNREVASPDGRWVATAGADAVHLWDAQSLRPQGKLPMALGGVHALAVSAQSNVLAAATLGSPSTLRVWAVADGRFTERATFAADHGSPVIALSPDGKTLAVPGLTSRIELWDTQTPGPQGKPKVQRSLDGGHQAWLSALAFSTDGKTLATGGDDGTLCLWDLTAAPPIKPHALIGHLKHAVASVAFSPDGKVLASCVCIAEKPGEIKLWHILEGVAQTTLYCKGSNPAGLKFSADGRLLAAGDSYGPDVALWDVVTPAREPRKIIKAPKGTLPSDFRKEGLLLVGNRGGALQLYDTNQVKPEPLFPPVGHELRVSMVAFAPDGGSLGTVGVDGTLRIWPLTGSSPGVGTIIQTRRESGDGRIAFGPNGKALFLINFYAGGMLARFERTPKGWETGPSINGISRNCGAVSPLGDYAVGFVPPHLRSWDVRGAAIKSVAEIDFDDEARVIPHRLALSPDGALVVIGCQGGPLRRFSCERGQLKEILPALLPDRQPIWSFAFTPDGRRLAAGMRTGQVRLFDLDPSGAKQQEPWTLEGFVYGLAYSPDGQLLAGATSLGRVRVWEAATGKTLHDWTFDGPVHGVAFAPDSRHLATANGNGTVYIIRVGVPAP